jgi:integrase/recombinase XerC
MNEIIEQFKRYSKAQGKSEKTIQDYLNNLELFFRYLHEQNDLDVNNSEILDLIMDDDVENYILYCQEDLMNAVTTINLKLTTLKQFFGFLNVKKIINTNPTKTVKLQTVPEVEREFLNVEEALQLISAVENNPKTDCNKVRDSFILKIFLYCGLRISEVNNLKVADIVDKDVLRIKGKRQRVRQIAVNDEIKKALQKYMDYRIKNNINNEILFTTSKGVPMSKRAIFDVVKKYAKLSGIQKDIHPHSLRHAYASITAQTTSSLELKRLLGHKNIATTDIYYHMDSNRAVEIANNNPLLKKAQEV